MLISAIFNTPHIYNKKTNNLAFYGKHKKPQQDTFEKQKEPYSVENSIDNFSAEFANLIKQKNCNKDNLKTLIRQYVPKTKLEHNPAELELNGNYAQYSYRSLISSNNKLHYPYKKIIVDMDKKDKEPIVFFNDLVHEMIHNLQINKEKEIYKKIYDDFYTDSLKAHSDFRDLCDIAVQHGENMISEGFDKKINFIKFLDTKNYEKTKKENIDNFNFDYTTKNNVEQVYDLGVLTILAQEEQAYTMADEMTLKHFKVFNKRQNKNKKMFENLKEVVLDDLKKTGMPEEKIEEYKALILS